MNQAKSQRKLGSRRQQRRQQQRDLIARQADMLAELRAQLAYACDTVYALKSENQQLQKQAWAHAARLEEIEAESSATAERNRKVLKNMAQDCVTVIDNMRLKMDALEAEMAEVAELREAVTKLRGIYQPPSEDEPRKVRPLGSIEQVC